MRTVPDPDDTSQVEGAFCTESVARNDHSSLPTVPTARTKEQRYNRDMSDHVIRISEAEASRNFADVLARVRAGAEVVIESGTQPVAVLRPAEPNLRLLSESLRLAKEHGSSATLDGDFAKDVEAAIESHREPLDPPAWD